MRINNIENHYPNLSSFPRKKQEEIFERARYETFISKGANGKWLRTAATALLLSLLVGLALGALLMKLLDIEAYWISGITAGCAGGIASYLQYKRYINQIRPEVDEIARSEN